jgi:hypothetical protein
VRCVLRGARQARTVGSLIVVVCFLDIIDMHGVSHALFDKSVKWVILGMNQPGTADRVPFGG